MSSPEFKDKFVAYVDVLGFKEMIEQAEDGSGRSLAEIHDILADLGNHKGRDAIKVHGPRACPSSKRIRSDLDFQLTQVSDCVIVSSEISPAGVINLIDHCWGG